MKSIDKKVCVLYNTFQEDDHAAGNVSKNVSEKEICPMSVITVKIDDELKKKAECILDELGLDIPTAVRMYLKSVVREKGPVLEKKCSAVSGPPAEAEKAPAGKAGTEDFIALICSVPSGSLTRWSDLEACLSARTGREVSVPKRAEWPRVNGDGLAIPYWRVVTERGAVRGYEGICSKELQEGMLRAEGYELVEVGHGIFTGLKVADYKSKLVTF